ncbi:MAG: ABC transporter ATP-binding protein [Candidatus Binatales bacterium]
MLTASRISKRFGRTIALDQVDFEARAGEIHVLLGENGAGKTTLANVLAGRIRPDAGALALDGNPLTAGSPGRALKAGIAAVHQSSMLFERLTWEENLALGGFCPDSPLLELDLVAARASELARKIGFALPPRGITVEQRSVAERVRLEVLRALSFNPRVLILDEPTGALGPAELAPFLDSLRRLRDEGRIVILITHKLAEALSVADRITVMRNARVVTTVESSGASVEELARLMVGELAADTDEPRDGRVTGDTALAISGLTLDHDGRRILDSVSFALARGEIAGIAGVDGNGQAELVEILAGARQATSGRVTITGARPDETSAMAVIPQNRDLDGLILAMQLWENMLLSRPIRKRFVRHGWLNRNGALDLCRELLVRFRIRAGGPEVTAASLSGGNRQRLEVARALAGEPRVLIAHDVCRGLDLAATAEVHRTLLSFASAGGAVMLLSSDLDELLKLSNRLAVLSRGRLREVAPEERNPEQLGMLIAGAW